MDKKEAIELLKNALTEIPHLRELHYDNQEFELWFNKVKTITKNGLDEEDCETLSSARLMSFPMRGIAPESSFIEHYQKEITGYETALKSIIQKYELLGFEKEPAITAEPEKTTELPIILFDKMQFHPKVVKASRELFKDGHYRDAIYRAFVEVNNFVKDKTGLSEDGKNLMSKVFTANSPIIKLNELKTRSNKDEQEGFMFLFMGAMEGIRNPKAHENIIQNDPYRALEYLGLASLLMKIAEEGKLEETS
jgi:uncharacterized protein (TIGR02391 family)